MFDENDVDVFIARQAILDRQQRLYAYELLFRPCGQDIAGPILDATASTLQVLSTTLLSAGLAIVAENTPVFINFGRDLLMTNWTSLFPSTSVVIEILESVEPDADVVAACMALKAKGYALALDDVTEESNPTFLELADIIKVDFRCTTPESQARLAVTHGRAGKRLLAEKVETLEEFERAKNLGFEYFQGFFFSKPVLLRGQEVSAMKSSVMRLLGELGLPEFDFDRLESLIKCDVSLTYKLLRYVNSALFARSKPISRVRGALIAMGELDIRRWIVLATLLSLSHSASRVLAVHALVRARFCESLATAAGLLSPSNAFLIGMFSLLDALTHRPLRPLLVELALPPEIVEPLLGRAQDSKMAIALNLVKCYEAGEWDQVGERSLRLGVRSDVVADIYLSAVNWAALMISGVGSALPAVKPDAGKSLSPDPHTVQSLHALQRILAVKSTVRRSVRN